MELGLWFVYWVLAGMGMVFGAIIAIVVIRLLDELLARVRYR